MSFASVASLDVAHRGQIAPYRKFMLVLKLKGSFVSSLALPRQLRTNQDAGAKAKKETKDPATLTGEWRGWMRPVRVCASTEELPRLPLG